MASFFSDAQLILQNQTVEGLSNTHNIRSWISSFLALTRIGQESFYRDMALYYPDRSAPQSTTPTENSGFASRRLLTANSTLNYFQCALPFSLSSSGLALPPAMDVKIVLINNRDTQRIMSGVANQRPRIQFTSLELHVTYITLNDAALLKVRGRQNAAPLPFPFIKTNVLMPTTLPAGVADANVTVLRGEIPDLILVGLQPASRTGNAYDQNWMDFRPCGLRMLQASVGGQLFPSQPHQCSFDGGDRSGASDLYSLLVMKELIGVGSWEE